MMDPRPKTEQPQEKTTPSVVLGPSAPAAPVKPIVTAPQPKGPDSGAKPSQVASPNDNARVPAQAKP